MSRYIESETIELKEKYTDTITKEIVSFLNSAGGSIIIGVKDDGVVVGVDKVDEILRKISDIITTKIEPNPQDEISSELKFDEGKTIVVIHINKGHHHIYCQKKYGFSSTGCTIRIGTTCKEMTSEQIKIRYEKKFIDNEYMLKKKSNSSDLSFRELKIYYSEKNYHLEDKSFETNLNLRNESGEYNLLAELLSDKNNIPFIFVKFQGQNKEDKQRKSKKLGKINIGTNDEDSITKSNATPLFLLFKQALATGLDCPRAKILVKLRENMSDTFEIQTLGRLRRMPKAKHYGKEILDCSYLYTFDEKYKLEVIKDGNGFETQRVFLKEEPKKIRLVKELRNLDGSYIGEQEIRNRVYEFFKNKYHLSNTKADNLTLLENNDFIFGTGLARKYLTGKYQL